MDVRSCRGPEQAREISLHPQSVGGWIVEDIRKSCPGRSIRWRFGWSRKQSREFQYCSVRHSAQEEKECSQKMGIPGENSEPGHNVPGRIFHASNVGFETDTPCN